jgi:hypothetical protein
VPCFWFRIRLKFIYSQDEALRLSSDSLFRAAEESGVDILPLASNGTGVAARAPLLFNFFEDRTAQPTIATTQSNASVNPAVEQARAAIPHFSARHIDDDSVPVETPTIGDHDTVVKAAATPSAHLGELTIAHPHAIWPIDWESVFTLARQFSRDSETPTDAHPRTHARPRDWAEQREHLRKDYKRKRKDAAKGIRARASQRGQRVRRRT